MIEKHIKKQKEIIEIIDSDQDKKQYAMEKLPD